MLASGLGGARGIWWVIMEGQKNPVVVRIVVMKLAGWTGVLRRGCGAAGEEVQRRQGLHWVSETESASVSGEA